MASSSPFKMEWKKKNGGSGSSSKRKRDDGPKKHRSAEFVRESNIGVVTKFNSNDVWSIVTDSDTHVVVRSLGETVDTFSSQQTVYLESAVEEDVIGGLQAQISSQGSKIARLEALIMEIEQRSTMKSKTLEERLDVSDLFAHQGMYNALSAFADLILGAFFKACGMEGLGARERGEFLSNRGPDGGEAFVSRKAVTVSFFGVEKRIGKREYRIIQSLRKASSGVSAAVSHSASPLEVATALEIEGASVFAGNLKEVCGLFQTFFDVSSKKMMQNWRKGQLNDDFKKKFKPDRPPL